MHGKGSSGDMVGSGAVDSCSSIRLAWLDPAASHELQAAHTDLFKHLNEKDVPPEIMSARAELLELGLKHCCRQKQKGSTAADKAVWPALRSYAAQHTEGGLDIACVRLQQSTPLSRVVAVGHLVCSSNGSSNNNHRDTSSSQEHPPAPGTGVTGVRCSHCHTTCASLALFQRHILGPRCEGGGSSSSEGGGGLDRLVLLPQHWTWGVFRGALRQRWTEHQAAAAPVGPTAAAGVAAGGQQVPAALRPQAAAAQTTVLNVPGRSQAIPAVSGTLGDTRAGDTLLGGATKHAIIKLSPPKPQTPGQAAKRAATATMSPSPVPKKQRQEQQEQGQDKEQQQQQQRPEQQQQQQQQRQGEEVPAKVSSRWAQSLAKLKRVAAAVGRCGGLTPDTLQQLQRRHAGVGEVAAGKAAPTPAQAAGREALLEAGLAALRRGRDKALSLGRPPITRPDAKVLLELAAPGAPLSEGLAQVVYVSGPSCNTIKAAARLGPGRVECCHCDATFDALCHWELHVAGRTGYVGSLHTLLLGCAWLAGGYVTALQERWAAEQGQVPEQGQGHGP